ncbi:MAG: ABC transporter ATP-binding protein [Pseudomonadota bacterium]
MTPLLAIRSLVVRYGQITALDGVSLEVKPGEAVALLGANGAGKSTLIKSVVGFLAPASGAIEFDGAPLADVAVAGRARRGIAYCPEGRRVFPGMSVRENLDVASRAPSAETARRIERVYALFPILAERAPALGWQLSGGQQQMLAIGRALMGEPRLLLLDEPSLGLSPRLVNDVLERVREIAAGGTAVLIAEQNVARALAITARAYVLQVGAVIESGPSAVIAESDRIKAAFLGGD